MKGIVVVMDVSGSMWSYLENIKKFLPSFFQFLVNMGYHIGLVSFSNDVYIKSYYTQNMTELKDRVEELTTINLTSLYDAILVGLVYENPHPEYLIVFSDGGDNCSDSDLNDWQTMATTLNIPVIPYPLDGFQDPNLVPYASAFTKKVITVPEAAKIWKEIAGKVKTVKIMKKPEDFLELKSLK
jgi:hypothetical protein